MNEKSIVIMYGITPCHAGSGSSLGVVDLPIQRERATNWPVIQASGVKGAFRANFEKYKNKISEDKRKGIEFDKLTESIFGTSGSGNDGGYMGAISVSDAKILAYPMRSNIAPFVWITCPSVLKRLLRDLDFAGKKADVKIPDVKGNDAKWIFGATKENEVLLEDYEVTPNGDEAKEILKDYLAQEERLLLVSDEVFNYGVSQCTQIMAQIQIDSKTGTTKEGSLRYQEELPSDTIMYSVFCWSDSKNKDEELKADMIQKFVKEEVIKSHIQIAGDETCGRGIFKLEWK